VVFVGLVLDEERIGELSHRLDDEKTSRRWPRWWFVCPLVVNGRPCNRRVGKLYLPGASRYFGCRHCYDLTYTSCQEHDKRVDRLRKLLRWNPGALNALVDERYPGEHHPAGAGDEGVDAAAAAHELTAPKRSDRIDLRLESAEPGCIFLPFSAVARAVSRAVPSEADRSAFQRLVASWHPAPG
jgi:hypothetical protein